MTLRAWPSSLAGRTTLLLLLALALLQGVGLTINEFDRGDAVRVAHLREVAMRATNLYRAVVLAVAEERPAVLRELNERDHTDASLDTAPPNPPLPPAEAELAREFRINSQLVPMRAPERPKESLWFGGPTQGRVVAGFKLPDDGRWLNVSLAMPPPRQWLSANFLAAFTLMAGGGGLLAVWAMNRMAAPVRTLAAAADRLGRDLNAPPLPEDGPAEVALAATAFNFMAARLRRMLADRNFMLAAIGHDLRTPITRLKLRAEFMEDDEQRRKMLADLDELEEMVSATLALGRDTASDEPLTAVDLVELVRTVLDETADARPEAAERLSYDGPAHLTIRARPFALKRALANLVTNAVKYGDGAMVSLHAPDAAGGHVSLMVEDNGPGIPPEETERLFQPFQRLEASRNKETGGVGLGLTIARNILRAHGGDVTLGNRPGGGARAVVSLPG